MKNQSDHIHIALDFIGSEKKGIFDPKKMKWRCGKCFQWFDLPIKWSYDLNSDINEG